MVSPIDFTPEWLHSKAGALIAEMEHNTQCTHKETSLQVLTRTENGELAPDVGSCSALNLPASTAGGAGAGAGESVAFSTSDSTFGVETAPGSCVCAAKGSAAGDVTGGCSSIGCDSRLGACFLLSCTSKQCILSRSSRPHAHQLGVESSLCEVPTQDLVLLFSILPQVRFALALSGRWALALIDRINSVRQQQA